MNPDNLGGFCAHERKSTHEGMRRCSDSWWSSLRS